MHTEVVVRYTEGVRRATLACVLAALLSLLALLPPVPAAQAATTVTFTPAAVPWAAPEIPNIGRGQDLWQGVATQPAGWPTRDVYYRDQVYWGRVEKKRGVYDFSQFDAGLAQAEALGGKFSFRVMAWCPGCWMEHNPYSSDKPPATPRWLPKQKVPASADQIYRDSPPPSWNSATYLDRWRKLMMQLGKRYDADPRLGTIDIGGYGAYGEWHTNGFGKPITVANAKKVVDAVLDAFPHHKVLINSMIPSYVLPALKMSPRVGLRQDCLGSSQMGWTFDAYDRIRTRWKKAPVVTEWCHSGDTTIERGAAQVTKYHVSMTSSGNAPLLYADMTELQCKAWVDAAKHAGYRYQLDSVTSANAWSGDTAGPVTVTFDNVGSAPTYDRWRVELRLLRGDGTVAATAPFPADLRKVLPGTKSFTGSVAFPGVDPGVYTLALAVVDPSGYAAPMALATVGRTLDGAYALGPVTVG